MINLYEKTKMKILDEDECIDLQTILRISNQINQEQAWAICYEIGLLMQRLSLSHCAPIRCLAQIRMHKDGFVHEKSCLVEATADSGSSSDGLTAPAVSPAKTSTKSTNHSPTAQQVHNTTPPTPPITPELSEVLRLKRPAEDESELVASLGIALFWALDYGIPDDEERKLSLQMECLIFNTQNKLSLDDILEICVKRLPIATKSHADSHYREVCQSLVGDTIQLSIFLEKIYTASMVLSDINLDDCLDTNHHHKCDISDADLGELREPLASLRALRINDWARLWMQVIRELRQRGNFKQALSVN